MVAVTLATALNLNAYKQAPFEMAGAASSDYFLKIEGVEGESKDDRHKGEIEINSWSWGATNMGSSGHGGGGGAGKANFQDISVTKFIDSTTEPLMLASFGGKHFPTATISVRKAGGTAEDYYKIKLTDVVISSFGQDGDGDQEMDSLSFSYAKIEYQYKPQSADGSSGTPKNWGWNLGTNKKV